MDPFDRQIVQYVIRWAPFGGPPDDEVFPCFGLTPAQLGQRFDEIASTMLSSDDSTSIDDHELRIAVRRVSRYRASRRAAAMSSR